MLEVVGTARLLFHGREPTTYRTDPLCLPYPRELRDFADTTTLELRRNDFTRHVRAPRLAVHFFPAIVTVVDNRAELPPDDGSENVTEMSYVLAVLFTERMEVMVGADGVADLAAPA